MDIDIMNFVKSNVDYSLLTNCFTFWACFYAVLLLLLECNYLVLLGSLFIYLIIHCLSLPRSDDITVNEILGVNPRDRLRLLSDALASDNSVDKCNRRKPDNKLLMADFVCQTIAHQAAGLDAPKNSLAAIKMCFNRGCKFVHLDVKLTADNVPILYSNEYARQKWMEGIIYLENSVEDLNWQDIKNADVSSQYAFEEKFAGENLSGLDDAVSLCMELDMKLIINLVHLNYIAQFNAMTDAITSLYDKYPNLYRKAILSSFNPIILYLIRKRKPEIIIALSWQPTLYFFHPHNCTVSWLNKIQYSGRIQKLVFETFDIFTLWSIDNVLYKVLNIAAIILHKDIITPSIVERWENKGIRVIASVVNLEIEKTYYSEAIGIAYLTDTLDTI